MARKRRAKKHWGIRGLVSLLMILAAVGIFFVSRYMIGDAHDQGTLNPKSIVITGDSQTVYAINDNVPISAFVSPSGYELSESDYFCSAGNFSFENNEASFSADTPGEYHIWVESKGIKSNTLTFIVEEKDTMAKADTEEQVQVEPQTAPEENVPENISENSHNNSLSSDTAPGSNIPATPENTPEEPEGEDNSQIPDNGDEIFSDDIDMPKVRTVALHDELVEIAKKTKLGGFGGLTAESVYTYLSETSDNSYVVWSESLYDDNEIHDVNYISASYYQTDGNDNVIESMTSNFTIENNETTEILNYASTQANSDDPEKAYAQLEERIVATAKERGDVPIQTTRRITCVSCNGIGQRICSLCSGKGWTLSLNKAPSLGDYRAPTTTRRTCYSCLGSGYKTCYYCMGLGFMEVSQ